MFEPVVELTGKSTAAIPIREEMETLNKHLADTTEKLKDMKQQPQQPTDDHTSNVLEQYLLKYGGSSRLLDKYFAI